MLSLPIKILWTRAQDDWPEDRARIEAYCLKRGIGPNAFSLTSLPCIAIRPIAHEAPDIPAASAFVFTSKNAAKYLHPHLMQRVQRSRCFAVGSSTAAALSQAGVVYSETPAKAHAQALMELLRSAKPNHVTWISGEEAQVDLAAKLTCEGIAVTRLITYRTDAVAPRLHLSLEEAKICFASPSAVKSFVDFFIKLPTSARLFAHLSAICIGASTAAACAGHFRHVSAAESSTIEELFAAALAK